MQIHVQEESCLLKAASVLPTTLKGNEPISKVRNNIWNYRGFEAP
jgi:hypothetical protein